MNEAKVKSNSFPYYGAEFRYRMFAHTDSLTCLNKATCMPVGGYSVWGGLRPINRTHKVVMAVAKNDAAGFFHDLVR